MKYVALLRAVNVGGAGKLPMTVLSKRCEAAGLTQVRTYIASGNVVFHSEWPEDQVRSALEDQLRAYAGKTVRAVVRTASEMAGVLARNPFADSPGNRVMALFVDEPLPVDPLDGVTGARNEQIRRGERELFVFYPHGMETTRLRLPSGKHGTARNMNTVAKLGRDGRRAPAGGQRVAELRSLVHQPAMLKRKRIYPFTHWVIAPQTSATSPAASA